MFNNKTEAYVNIKAPKNTKTGSLILANHLPVKINALYKSCKTLSWTIMKALQRSTCELNKI